MALDFHFDYMLINYSYTRDNLSFGCQTAEVEKVLEPRNVVPRKSLTSQKLFWVYNFFFQFTFSKKQKIKDQI